MGNHHPSTIGLLNMLCYVSGMCMCNSLWDNMSPDMAVGLVARYEAEGKPRANVAEVCVVLYHIVTSYHHVAKR
jgi:hypothetical protein